ncbi:DEAD/DEAH box helicase [Alicyclobacillus acidocaldarius]|uniref:DEAD/DEAH box helicase domain protein n=1 Tax=Alicyclobacillus acidocaldarius (strain Tc-4-1) TaxID=1048834 RepID=F8IL12_ALIAT|nr:DEAD/DEAH box helicase [Alicyclobacillus acidocaldarius]AEJ42392.1 DEAD/DEAH box helicase domain protein [Alicyclobacillus acidocaldarius subsp. acidocaldarius Tc-4-1]
MVVDLQTFYEKHGFARLYEWTLPPREAGYEPVSALGEDVAPEVRRYLENTYHQGLYRHQVKAIRAACQGENVCLATGTASGKSALFFAAGIDVMAKRYKARVLAMYPTRALGREQADRWREAIQAAGADWKVSLMDGGVPVAERESLLRKSDVIVMTPDVVHTWLLPTLSSAAVRTFLTHLRLVVVDEVHTYSGVMGTNSAFLFRRLAHVADVLGGAFRIVCASATIAKPEEHVAKLFGRRFFVVGTEDDTSLRHLTQVDFVALPAGGDLLQAVALLLRHIAGQGRRAIAFLDSRQRVEIIGSILQRQDEDEPDDGEALGRNLRELEQVGILPYRSGYEEADRQAIQRGLTSGALRGVVSTSALELGMDIPNLDVAVLVGVPQSQTSLLQRIGRVGRRGPGHVVILHAQTALDDAVLANPSFLWERPLTEAVLYLDHRRAQYIHAMCLAGIGGEHDLALNRRPGDPDAFQLSEAVEWPDGFAELCLAERSGQIPPEFETMRIEAGDSPHRTYLLRDMERRFTVELQAANELDKLGDLSMSQVMREAYPGAIYRYMGRCYRVMRVYHPSGKIVVRPEKRYHTKPSAIPARISPQIDRPGTTVYQAGTGFIVASDLLVHEMVTGFVEYRGRTPHRFDYPIHNDPDLRGVQFDMPLFQRRYVTHGVSFFHPDLRDHDALNALMSLLLEAYAFVVPFDTQDVAVGIARVSGVRNPSLPQDARLLTLYDRVYGSLHLAARILEPGVLPRVAEQMEAFLHARFWNEIDPDLRPIAKAWVSSLREPLVSVGSEAEAAAASEGESRVRVILPGSVGYVELEGRRFLVDAVFFKPSGLHYRGRYPDDTSHQSCEIQLPVHLVAEMPGESRWGFYDIERGEVVEVSPEGNR